VPRVLPPEAAPGRGLVSRVPDHARGSPGRLRRRDQITPAQDNRQIPTVFRTQSKANGKLQFYNSYNP